MSRPDPQWHIVVDAWLSLPYPEWYMDCFLSRLQPDEHPVAFLGTFAAAAAAAGTHAAALAGSGVRLEAHTAIMQGPSVLRCSAIGHACTLLCCFLPYGTNFPETVNI